MRQLNQQELENVSGAGFIADTTAAVGLTVGQVINMGLNMVGIKVGTQPSDAAQTMGRSVGMIIETGVSVANFVFSALVPLFRHK